MKLLIGLFIALFTVAVSIVIYEIGKEAGKKEIQKTECTVIKCKNDMYEKFEGEYRVKRNGKM